MRHHLACAKPNDEPAAAPVTCKHHFNIIVHRCRLLVAVLAVATAACGQEAALNITLVPNPNVTDPAKLLEMLGTVKIVVDSFRPSEQLYPPGTTIEQGFVRVFDEDGDGAAELVATIDTSEMDHLPVMRLEQGGLPDVIMKISVQGLARGPEEVRFADGSVPSVQFTPAVVQSLPVPFDINPLYMPPYVEWTNPRDGDTLTTTDLGAVALAISKQMDASTLQQPGVVRVLRVEPSGETLVPAQQIDVEPYSEQTLVYYRFATALLEGTYRVRVSTDARDTTKDRLHLDQVPIQAGNQAFLSSFQLTTKE